jgi:Rad3-related DNA helicase
VIKDRTNEITKAFTELRFKPREGQIKICNDILSAYIDEGMQNVLLCADTGVGKSIIAAVVANVLGEKNQNDRKAVFISSTNSLVNQYADTFVDQPDEEFFRIKGASNYQCNYFVSKSGKETSAEECVSKELTEIEKNRFCSKCDFKKAKEQINNTENLITNYSYFMIGRLLTKHVNPRNLHVFDEAHLMNDVFCDQFGISLSVVQIDKQVAELKTVMNGKANNFIADLVMLRDNIKHKMINGSNYNDYLITAKRIYGGIARLASQHSSLIPDMSAKAKMKKVASKYAGIQTSIAEFFIHAYDHVFDDSAPDQIAVKPIFISKMINGMLARHNLFMTATLSLDFAKTTLNLDEKTTKYIDAAPVFPASNRPLFFVGKDSLNYAKMQQPSTFTEIGNIVNLITQNHNDDKGIMLVPSFSTGRQICQHLKGTKVFEHVSGTKIVDIMKTFKEYKGSAILVSPSIFEGLDFQNDQSRYQIIVKTPFAMLGDKRIKRIAEEYPNIYREIALYKIIQGIGRSIRSPSDFAATYFLDKSSETLFNSNLNGWKHRFEVMAK